MLSLFRSLLYLYPRAYRYEFNEEMLAVLCEVQTEMQKKGTLAQIIFLAQEAGGLLFGALQEHLRTLTRFHGKAISSLGRFAMRSEFKFPKATVLLMALILAGILLAIHKAKAIQASVAYANPQVGPIHSTQQFMLLPTLLVVLAGACIAGAIGWAFFFALRRTGMHRLSNVDSSSRQHSGGTLSI